MTQILRPVSVTVNGVIIAITSNFMAAYDIARANISEDDKCFLLSYNAAWRHFRSKEVIKISLPSSIHFVIQRHSIHSNVRTWKAQLSVNKKLVS